MGNNMNRLKAGAVLNVPSIEAAQQVVAAAGTRGSFAPRAPISSAYRQRLAKGVTTPDD